MNRSILSTTGLVCAVACSVLTFSSGQAQQAGAVYKWTDAQGGVHYTDKPPPSDAKLLSSDLRGSSPPSPAPRPAASKDSPNAAPADLSGLKGAVAEDVQKAKEEQCKAAQERYQTDVRSRRVYRNGPDNQRTYLTDSELEAERLDAKREVDAYCNPSN